MNPVSTRFTTLAQVTDLHKGATKSFICTPDCKCSPSWNYFDLLKSFLFIFLTEFLQSEYLKLLFGHPWRMMDSWLIYPETFSFFFFFKSHLMSFSINTWCLRRICNGWPQAWSAFNISGRAVLRCEAAGKQDFYFGVNFLKLDLLFKIYGSCI